MIKKYPDFWQILLGSAPLGAFLGYTTLALIAAIVSILIDISKRNIDSSATPKAFSLKFWFAHNLLRFVANVLAIPLAIRLLLTWESASPALLVFFSILLGFGIDIVAMALKNAGVLATNKLADKIKDRLEQGK